MKEAMVPIGKGKAVAPFVSSPLAELAKLTVKVNAGLMEALLPEACQDKELLAKQFCSSWNHK